MQRNIYIDFRHLKIYSTATNYFKSNTKFSDGMVIKICSIQYDECYYQKEAMVPTMINWCEKVFGFQYKEIKTAFDKQNNKYIFDF